MDSISHEPCFIIDSDDVFIILDDHLLIEGVNKIF